MTYSYLIIAGLFFLIFYVLGRKILVHRKIQQYFPKIKELRREIVYSLISTLIFGLVSTLAFHSSFLNAYGAYPLWGKYFHHWFYIPVFYLLMLFLHDTYFYWTHRMMHHRLLFRWVHRTHHRSVTPSPWAALAFNPLEALIQIGITPLLLLIVPLPPMHVNIFFLCSLIYIVYGHLGYELYPRSFNRHWLGKWINTAVNHDLHHQEGRRSFGIYFTFWDRLMGTMSRQYDQQFDMVTNRSSPLLQRCRNLSTWLGTRLRYSNSR